MCQAPFGDRSVLFSKEITEIVYGRGQFEQDAVVQVGQILSIYSIDILLIPLQTIMIKAFHSMEDTKFPFKVNCITVVLNVVLSMILFQAVGLRGIAIGTVISFAVSCLLLIISLRRRIGWNKKELGLRHLGAGLCGLLFVALEAYGAGKGIENILYRIIAGSFIGFIGYLLIMGFFLKKERNELFSYIKEILRK